MVGRPHLRLLAAGTVAAAVLVATATMPGGSVDRGRASTPPGALLPDLDQEAPSQLVVHRTASNGWALGFASAIRNIGDGPMRLEGHRTTSSATVMQVDQVLDEADGSQHVVRGVGELTYVVSPDHQHWHYVGFDRYELRRAGSDRAQVRDRKSGFCLGDRYSVDSRVVTGAATRPVYTEECGRGDPDLDHVVEGISVGYGDNYAANLEFQELPLDGLPDGRYVLVHHVNQDRTLEELTYANNGSSLLLDLRWQPDGTPAVATLAQCPDSERCDRQVAVTTVATGLEIPWDLAFLPNGDALVTERPGRVRLLTADGRLEPKPVARLAVSGRGEGGLLGIVVDPQFARNRFVYLYYTGARSMRLERWRWTGSSLEPDATLLDDILSGDVHDSGRLGFAPDDRLFLATGDAGHPSLAQDPASLNGKMLALTPTQYRGDGTVRPTVIARGLRNSQGFDWQPASGMLVANDHGPTGFDGPEGYDEVDVIVPGGNYGWPEAISNQTDGGRYLAPRRIYVDAIAPSGGTFLTAPSAWTGDYVLAALRGEELRRLAFEDGRVVVDEPLLRGVYGRLRTVVEAPDGSLYVLTSNRDGRGAPRSGDDRILRIDLPAS